jgi:hypothetical protein
VCLRLFTLATGKRPYGRAYTSFKPKIVELMFVYLMLYRYMCYVHTISSMTGSSLRAPSAMGGRWGNPILSLNILKLIIEMYLF